MFSDETIIKHAERSMLCIIMLLSSLRKYFRKKVSRIRKQSPAGFSKSLQRAPSLSSC